MAVRRRHALSANHRLVSHSPAFFLLLALTLLAMGVTSGCAPVRVVGEVAGAAFEDRLAEDQVTDSKIKGAIISRFSDIDKTLLLDLSIDVWEGRVMLTGVLDDSKLRNTAIRAAQNDKRIVNFYNAVKLVTKQEKEERRTWKEKAEAGASTVGGIANDFWIETKIKAQLLTTKGVTSVNYRWRAVHGVVYIIGRASSSSELSTVLGIIRKTTGVKGVEPYVKIQSAS